MMRSPWYRLFLSTLLMLSIAWLWYSHFDELAYHTFGDTKLVDIGDAKNFAEVKDTITPNTYVSVSGILGNKAATLKGLRSGSFRFGRYQVRHLLGSKLYIEYSEAAYNDSFRPFMRVNVKGRLISFGPDSELVKVRQFFKEYYNTQVDDGAMLIVVDETPRSEYVYALFAGLSIVLLVISFYFSFRGFRHAAR